MNLALLGKKTDSNRDQQLYVVINRKLSKQLYLADRLCINTLWTTYTSILIFWRLLKLFQDPYVRNALPDRIEDNLDDGMATCCAFNRRGTLLGNIQVKSIFLRIKEILTRFQRLVATMEGQLYGTLKHEALPKYWSVTCIQSQLLGKCQTREIMARSEFWQMILAGLVTVARFSLHQLIGTCDYGMCLQLHLISMYLSTRQFCRRRSILEAGKFNLHYRSFLIAYCTDVTAATSQLLQCGWMTRASWIWPQARRKSYHSLTDWTVND